MRLQHEKKKKKRNDKSIERLKNDTFHIITKDISVVWLLEKLGKSNMVTNAFNKVIIPPLALWPGERKEDS